MNIQQIQNSKTKLIGKTIKYQEQITSTHIIAKQIATRKINSTAKIQFTDEPKTTSRIETINGTIILADLQTAGIGTKGRKWYTGKGKNIAMTIILKPKCKIEKLQNLTKTIAISMQQAIKELYQYYLTIKEPNDLLLNGKKICGILTEISTISEQINYLLISVGFNVNEEEFSPETETIATSLKKEYHKDFQREEIITKFIEILENNILEEIEL